MLGLAGHFDLSSVTEWTLEANPATFDLEKAKLMRALGADRISLGIQSFQSGVLTTLGRDHSPTDAIQAYETLRTAGFENVSIDLMFSIPGQNTRLWQADLEQAVALAPQHFSAYNLTYEEDTDFLTRHQSGELDTNEDRDADLFYQAIDFLEANGYAHYEISNYARPGCACLHNLACWRGEDYLGLGPAAASRIGLTRRTHAADAAAYRAAITSGSKPLSEEVTLSPVDDATERFVFSLRLAEGGSPRSHAERWPAAGPNVAAWERRLDGLARNGITEAIGPGRWRLTARGREVADAVGRELLE
jgi:oxygen-independent coproporphyrinogen-3 oxidase